MTKGPLGKFTMGCVLFVAFAVASLAIFWNMYTNSNMELIEEMKTDVTAATQINTILSAYTGFNRVEYTQDGNITLMHDEEIVGTVRVRDKAQLEVLHNVKSIYRDDYGVTFLYGNNFFSVIPRLIFSQLTIEDIKNKRGDNEVVTKVADNTYMVVYMFDYNRFLSPEKIKEQLGALSDVVSDGAEEFLANEQDI